MNILHINTADILGGAGIAAYRLHQALNKRPDIHSQLLVGIKRGTDENTSSIVENRFQYYINRLFHRAALKIGWDGFKVFSPKKKLRESVKRADVIHLHNVHGGFFSLPSILQMAEKKPVVWTLHDMWALTGGCCFSYDCTRYLQNCITQKDNSYPCKMPHRIYKKKKAIYQKSKIELILPSLYMNNIAKESPLIKDFNAIHIRFGIDLSNYRPLDKINSKRCFGIDENSTVVAFRASNDKQKGLSFAIEAMQRLQSKSKVSLLTFDQKGLVANLYNKYSVVELGWVKDPSIMAKAFSAMDIFLMPSTAESFGLMAMEAMACGTVVLAFDNTVLSETLFAPAGGITVPQGDTECLKFKLEELIDNHRYRFDISGNAVALAKRHYDIESHVSKVVSVYNKLLIHDHLNK